MFYFFSLPLRHQKLKHDSVAQLVEQLTLNQWVESSSLSGVTESKAITNKICGRFLICTKNLHRILKPFFEKQISILQNKFLSSLQFDEEQSHKTYKYHIQKTTIVSPHIAFYKLKEIEWHHDELRQFSVNHFLLQPERQRICHKSIHQIVA